MTDKQRAIIAPAHGVLGDAEVKIVITHDEVDVVAAALIELREKHPEFKDAINLLIKKVFSQTTKHLMPVMSPLKNAASRWASDV